MTQLDSVINVAGHSVSFIGICLSKENEIKTTLFETTFKLV